ncbi:hypothetical protein AURDEDRAFT_129170 [Auricularia subglabra TFB-10046 SS5]|uniref:DUF6535 domain-containing protein n=1 Tax=Auricularia subglabra (strain TFB-10046 / SS5) TaxID=717982 RepID=J0WUZ1_AURST|nr:hypothetical protein AURDEDRAFT_129170 [Auricularia subglabra TFB-10046 SS5]
MLRWLAFSQFIISVLLLRRNVTAHSHPRQHEHTYSALAIARPDANFVVTASRDKREHVRHIFSEERLQWPIRFRGKARRAATDEKGVPALMGAGLAGQPKGSERPEGYDTLGSELDENARIWHVFRTDVSAHDQNVTIHEWNETLDILLVFTYPSPPGQDGTGTSAAVAQDSVPPLVFRVMIGLFFVSLLISLAVSLVCILAKQWLQEYIRRLTETAANARLWAHRRWVYMHGLEQWRIGILATDGLPFLLHVALFLFAVGLTMLLMTINHSVAWFACTITTFLAAVYIGCTLAPIFWVTAPTATPLLKHLRNMATLMTGLRSSEGWRSLPTRLGKALTGVWHDVFLNYGSEDDYIAYYSGTMEFDAILWLLTDSRSEDGLTVAFCAVSALPSDSEALDAIRRTGIGIADAFQNMPSGKLRAIDVTRVVRSELRLRPGDWRRPKLGLDIPNTMLDLLREAQSADAGVLSAVMQKDLGLKYISENAIQWRDMDSHSLPSTVQLLLLSKNIDLRAILYLMLPVHVKDLCALRRDISTALGRGARNEDKAATTTDFPQVLDEAGCAGSCTPACALVSLVQVTTRLACTPDDFAAAAHLAARIVRFVKTGSSSKIHTHIAAVRWESPLSLIGPKTEVIFGTLDSRDPILGWCRTQGRILNALVVGWHLMPRSRERVLTGYRVGFLLESLLKMLHNPKATPQVQEVMVFVLFNTFLDTETDIDKKVTVSPDAPPNESRAEFPPWEPPRAAWDEIHQLNLSHTTLVQLAVTLAAILCTSKREQPNGYRAAFARGFLRGDMLRILLSDSSRAERVGPSRAYLHLAQHCVELERDWCSRMARRGEDESGAVSDAFGVLASWLVALNRTRSSQEETVSGVSESSPLKLRAATGYFLAEKLEKAVAELGPCTSCAGTPPAWPPSYPLIVTHTASSYAHDS